jgi:hypothetical protein
MKTGIKIFYLLIAIFCICPFIRGEVFTLYPRSLSGEGGDSVDVLNPKNILSEPVIINGVKLTLDIGMIDMELEELLFGLKKFFPNAKIAANSNSILIKQTLKDGMRRRILLVCPGAGLPILQFSLLFPAKMPEKINWPEQLPRTADGIPQQYMYFPNRKAYYGVFKTGGRAADALLEITGSLRANGWREVSSEAVLPEGRGEIFFRDNPRSLMLVNFDDDGTAVVYTRPVK